MVAGSRRPDRILRKIIEHQYIKRLQVVKFDHL